MIKSVKRYIVLGAVAFSMLLSSPAIQAVYKISDIIESYLDDKLSITPAVIKRAIENSTDRELQEGLQSLEISSHILPHLKDCFDSLAEQIMHKLSSGTVEQDNRPSPILTLPNMHSILPTAIPQAAIPQDDVFTTLILQGNFETAFTVLSLMNHLEARQRCLSIKPNGTPLYFDVATSGCIPLIQLCMQLTGNAVNSLRDVEGRNARQYYDKKIMQSTTPESVRPEVKKIALVHPKAVQAQKTQSQELTELHKTFINAVHEGNTQMVEALLMSLDEQYALNLCMTIQSNGRPLLFEAIKNKHKEIVQLFIKYGQKNIYSLTDLRGRNVLQYSKNPVDISFELVKECNCLYVKKLSGEIIRFPADQSCKAHIKALIETQKTHTESFVRPDGAKGQHSPLEFAARQGNLDAISHLSEDSYRECSPDEIVKLIRDLEWNRENKSQQHIDACINMLARRYYQITKTFVLN